MHDPLDKSPVRADAAISQQGHSQQAQSNILQMIWQRKWLVLLGAVAGLIVGSIVYSQSKPVYRSTAQVLVIKKRTEVVPVPGADLTQSFLEDYVSTHIALIKSPKILNDAVDRGKLRELKTFQGHGNLPASIAGTLAATRDASGGNRTIIDLTFQGIYQDETGTILQAVIDSYTNFLSGAYQNVSKDTEKLIEEARDLLKKDLEEKEVKYKEFRDKTPILIFKGKEGINPHQERLLTVESKRSALVIEKAELEGRLHALEQAKKEGKTTVPFVPLANGTKESIPDTQRADDHLLTLLLEKQELLEDYGKDHPRVKAVTAKIERAKQFISQSQTGGELIDKAEVPIDRYMRTYQQQLAQNDISMQALSQLLEEEKKQAKVGQEYETEDKQFQDQLKRSQALYDQTISKLESINLARNFGGYNAEVIAPPGLGAAIAANLLRMLIMSMGLGLLGGVGLAYLADITDRSFRTPEEIRRSLGLNIMGHIPYLLHAEKKQQENTQETGEPKIDSSLCVYHRSISGESEAYRSLRTALFFGAREKDYKVIQVTSPNQGDGKTTLAGNLAVAIAQSGKRIILIDADLRRPRVHALFGFPSRLTGLSDVIMGAAPLATTIHETPVAGLDLLMAGSKVPNPAELLTSAELERLLTELRNDYDYVMVDTPPLLAVTDPCIVAGRVDTLLLTIRVSKNGRPAAERAKELLSNIGANVMGVVVNGIGGGGGKYGYGKYGYGYGYNYGYRYYSYYNYGYSDYNKAYQESEEETPQPDISTNKPGEVIKE